MSKPVKNLIIDSYRRQFVDLDSAAVVDLSGINANDNKQLRGSLAQKQMRISVVKNSLAKRAWKGTALSRLSEVVDGPSAVVYGGESAVDITRELISQGKEIKNLDIRGALMEGELFDADRVEELSKYPTLDEARAQALQLICSAGQNLAAFAVGPGRRIGTIVKVIEEKLDKGEQITKTK